MSLKIMVFFTGVVYLIFGIAGFFPSLVYLPPPRVGYYEMHMLGYWGYLFTWLPVNPVHDIVYIIIGGIALPAAIWRSSAILYSRATFFLMVIFTIIGFLPFGISYLFGFIPLFDWNIMVHSVTAMLLYYFGFIYPLDLGGREPDSEMIVLTK